MVFFFSIKSRSLFCVLSLKTPPLGGRGESRVSRLLRPAYSRTLCLPCPRAGFLRPLPFHPGNLSAKTGVCAPAPYLRTNRHKCPHRLFWTLLPLLSRPRAKPPDTGHTGLNTDLAFFAPVSPSPSLCCLPFIVGINRRLNRKNGINQVAVSNLPTLRFVLGRFCDNQHLVL